MREDLTTDVFGRLSEEIKKMPDEIIDLYKKITKEAVISTGKEMARTLQQTSGSQSLNQHMTQEIVISDDYYAYYISWADDISVNADKGKSGKYGGKREIQRKKGKRNYTLRPATYHDLAYIIDFGHTVHFKDGRTGFVEGNKFIQRAYRKVIKGWKNRRDEQFVVASKEIAKKFE